MEKDAYSVHTKDEVKEMMKKEIDTIMEIFTISNSDATAHLMKYRWDSESLSESLAENNDTLCVEAGLKSVTSNLESIMISPNLVFYEFIKNNVDVGGDYLVSTMKCHHAFYASYWREYLKENLKSPETLSISCPKEGCPVLVGPDTIQKLKPEDMEIYERMFLKSYLRGIKRELIKQCPHPGCEYIIKFRQKSDLKAHSPYVVCLCGHIFCWRCDLESHVPVTCNKASDWLFKDLTKFSEEANQSSTLSWIETNTKPCPHCSLPVQLDAKEVEQFMTCVCSGRFCRLCFHAETSHIPSPGYQLLECPKTDVALGNIEQVEISCVDRWEAGQVSLAEAKSALRAFEESMKDKTPSNLMKGEVANVREGLMLVVQCRQVLKWISVYDYIFSGYETAKKEYLEFLQGYAATLVQNYSESLKEAIEKAKDFSDDVFNEVICFRDNLNAKKSDIGNYFYHFGKSIQGGLADVKVMSYDNYSRGPYWYCDRCSDRYSWFIKKCQRCCGPTARIEPMEEGEISESEDEKPFG